jgi:hypothetical protein
MPVLVPEYCSSHPSGAIFAVIVPVADPSVVSETNVNSVELVIVAIRQSAFSPDGVAPAILITGLVVPVATKPCPPETVAVASPLVTESDVSVTLPYPSTRHFLIML